MRHEPGHRESVAEEILPRLEGMERKILRLSDPAGLAAALRDILADASYIAAACAAVRDFQPLIPVLREFQRRIEKSIRACDTPGYSVESRTGGLFLQAVNGFRQAVLHLGSGTRQAGMVLKILGQLERALALSGESDELEDAFLRESGRLMPKLEEIARNLARSPADGLADERDFTEIFRIVHTLKGNAAMAGFSAMSAYADAVETALSALREKLPRDGASARFLLSCFADLRDALALYASDSRRPIDLAAKATSVRAWVEGKTRQSGAPAESQEESEARTPFFDTGAGRRRSDFVLIAKVSGQELVIPCESVERVLRNPRVLPIPRPRAGWRGAIEAGGLMPLIDPGVTTGGWAVVIHGFALAVDDVEEVIEIGELKRA